jgi:hypothetical protein
MLTIRIINNTNIASFAITPIRAALSTFRDASIAAAGRHRRTHLVGAALISWWKAVAAAGRTAPVGRRTAASKSWR